MKANLAEEVTLSKAELLIYKECKTSRCRSPGKRLLQSDAGNYSVTGPWRGDRVDLICPAGQKCNDGNANTAETTHVED